MQRRPDCQTSGQPRRPSVRKLDGQAVRGRLDMWRQPTAQLVIVEVRMQIGQDRPPRLECLDKLERLVDAEVRRMWLVAERVNDPDIEVGERREALGREPDQIAGISEAAEAEAERGDVAMVLEDGKRGEGT